MAVGLWMRGGTNDCDTRETAETLPPSQMVGPRDVINKSHAEITQYEKRNLCHILKVRFHTVISPSYDSCDLTACRFKLRSRFRPYDNHMTFI